MADEPNHFSVPALAAMAKLMGATKTSAGKFYEFNMEQLFREYGITSDPLEAKSVSRKQISESKTGIPNAKAVKVRYGKYTSILLLSPSRSIY